MKLNKNINYRLLVLYLKYGYISLPGFRTIYKNKKINKWIKPPYRTNLNTTTKDCLSYLEKRCAEFVINQKKKEKKICLLLSSGQDSRLLYKLLEKAVIRYNYQKNFFCFTGKISHSNNHYDESSIIKKLWVKKPLNHHVVSINKNDFIKNIVLANKINFQPVNGLPNIIFMTCVKKIIKKFDFKKVTIVAGISDQIFFNVLKKQAQKQQSKKISLISANEGTIFTNSQYLTKKFDKVSDQIFKNIKSKNFFKQKNLYLKYINQMAYNFRGPKVITEFQNIFTHFKVGSFTPFVEKKFQELILSLKTKDLHDGKHKKTFIYNANLIIDPFQKPISGLKVISPQREILYENRKKILKIINTSILVEQKIIDKKKILETFNNYLADFVKYKKSQKKFEKFNSYSLWKFLSSEIFLRGCK
jgi:asparagine synthetase B (glutamine-hydrolysing)